jgi:SAM-dependent methyltransferase
MIIKACTSCKSSSLLCLKDNWNICKKCTLVFKKQNNKYDFKFNYKYQWGQTSNKSESNYIHRVNDSGKNFNKFLNLVKNNTKLKNILDFGSGDGPLLEYLKKYKYNAIGIEPSMINSHYSQKKGHKVLKKYLYYNTFKKNTFDIIVCFYSLTYIKDLNSLFQIFNKIIKKNGYIFILVHQYKFTNYLANKKIFKITGQNNMFSSSSLINVLKINNFNYFKIKNKINGTEIIAQKKFTKKKLIGNYKFEIFYLKYISYIIANILNYYLFVKTNIKKKILRNIKIII